jgi:hypothetical protein
MKNNTDLFNDIQSDLKLLSIKINELKQWGSKKAEEKCKKCFWEELKEDCREVEKANDYILYERLQQLEQKYGIGE